MHILGNYLSMLFHGFPDEFFFKDIVKIGEIIVKLSFKKRLQIKHSKLTHHPTTQLLGEFEKIVNNFETNLKW